MLIFMLIQNLDSGSICNGKRSRMQNAVRRHTDLTRPAHHCNVIRAGHSQRLVREVVELLRGDGVEADDEAHHQHTAADQAAASAWKAGAWYVQQRRERESSSRAMKD